MKLKTLLFLFAAVSVALFSCSKDDDNPGSNSGNIVGTWDLQTVHIVASKNGETIGDTTYSYTEDGDYSKATFLSDNTFRSETSTDGETETETGTYVYKNGKLTLTPDDEAEADPSNPLSITTMKCKITGKKMVLTASYSASINEETQKVEFTVHAVKE